MKHFGILFSFLIFGCVNSVSEGNGTEESMASETTIEDLKIYDYDGLEPLLNKKDNKVYVVNFWATWCAPCVKELPYFEKLQQNYVSRNVEVILVSLDFPRQYETKLIPFIQKNKLQSRVVAFDDTDQNRWIPAIDESWSGAIPATLIYTREEREFYERSFTYEEIETELQQFLN